MDNVSPNGTKLGYSTLNNNLCQYNFMLCESVTQWSIIRGLIRLPYLNHAVKKHNVLLFIFSPESIPSAASPSQ